MGVTEEEEKDQMISKRENDIRIPKKGVIDKPK